LEQALQRSHSTNLGMGTTTKAKTKSFLCCV
jgi:hypothetical protein